MPAPGLRTAGRIILLDAESSVLLVHERERAGSGASTRWLTPGGGIEADETPAQAARRELFEEAGIAVDLDRDEPAWHRDTVTWSIDGTPWIQTNHYFVARLNTVAPEVTPGALTELEEQTMLGWRWWSVQALRETDEVIWPHDLVSLLSETQPIPRISGRVILVDASDRVLMLEHRTSPDVDETVWAVPGGGVEDGESTAQAARRELMEECGIDISLADNAVAVHTERRMFHFGGVAYDQSDHFYIVRVAQRPEIVVTQRTELEELTVLGHRWFSVEDLHNSDTRYEPKQLIELISAVAR
jgi:8-oxo-dGTP pyrophosphatase MutT (NUDIX family)